MKKREVYERKYKGKQVDEYYDLICNIRRESYPDLIRTDGGNMENGWSERVYLNFDGDFFVIVSKNHLNQQGNNINIARITVEKMGPDVNKESQIEKMLLEKGFKIVEEK